MEEGLKRLYQIDFLQVGGIWQVVIDSLKDLIYKTRWWRVR